MKYYFIALSKKEILLYTRTNDELENGYGVTRIPANYIVESCKDRLFRMGCLVSLYGQYLTKKGKRNLSVN